jgi:hypothetical protein
MDYYEIQVLIEKYLGGWATEEEARLVDAWYNSFDTEAGITSVLTQEQMNDSQVKGFSAIINKLSTDKE